MWTRSARLLPLALLLAPLSAGCTGPAERTCDPVMGSVVIELEFAEGQRPSRDPTVEVRDAEGGTVSDSGPGHCHRFALEPGDYEVVVRAAGDGVMCVYEGATSFTHDGGAGRVGVTMREVCG